MVDQGPQAADQLGSDRPAQIGRLMQSDANPQVRLALGEIAHMELDNPPMNLVTDQLLDELDAALATLETCAPGDVRAVVVSSSSERAFSAGSDVKAFESH